MTQKHIWRLFFFMVGKKKYIPHSWWLGLGSPGRCIEGIWTWKWQKSNNKNLKNLLFTFPALLYNHCPYWMFVMECEAARGKSTAQQIFQPTLPVQMGLRTPHQAFFLFSFFKRAQLFTIVMLLLGNGTYGCVRSCVMKSELLKSRNISLRLRHCRELFRAIQFASCREGKQTHTLSYTGYKTCAFSC